MLIHDSMGFFDHYFVFLKPSTTGQRQLRIGNPCEDRSIAQGNKNSTFVDAVLDA
jgi:hypothetical protein